VRWRLPSLCLALVAEGLMGMAAVCTGVCPRWAGVCPRWAGVCPRWASVCPRWASVRPRWAGVRPRWAGVCPRWASVCPRWASVCPRWAGVRPRWAGAVSRLRVGLGGLKKTSQRGRVRHLGDFDRPIRRPCAGSALQRVSSPRQSRCIGSVNLRRYSRRGGWPPRGGRCGGAEPPCLGGSARPRSGLELRGACPPPRRDGRC
jgi:DNA-directed RNA polymerase II subunit RPB1